MQMNHILLIGAVALGGYLLAPQILDRVLPLVGSMRTLNMHLDPDVEPGEVEDRRGHHGGRDIHIPGGGGDMGAGPNWGPSGGQGGGGDAHPWDEARGGDPPPDPRGDRCWDRVEHRDVDMAYCDGDQGGRRR